MRTAWDLLGTDAHFCIVPPNLTGYRTENGVVMHTVLPTVLPTVLSSVLHMVLPTVLPTALPTVLPTVGRRGHMSGFVVGVPLGPYGLPRERERGGRVYHKSPLRVVFVQRLGSLVCMYVCLYVCR